MVIENSFKVYYRLISSLLDQPIAQKVEFLELCDCDHVNIQIKGRKLRERGGGRIFSISLSSKQLQCLVIEVEWYLVSKS